MMLSLTNNIIISCKESNDRRFIDVNGNTIHFETIPYFEPIMMIQTSLFIPHLNILMSGETISYFRAMRHLLFSFSFIRNGLQDSNVKRNNTYLYLIDIQSKESWINMVNSYAIL